jgi:hypothetical protein
MNREDMVLARLLALLQSTLFGLPPAENRFVDMDADAWNVLYRRTVKEGVMAAAFDGMMRLPEHLHPPRMLKLTWGAGVHNIEQNHTHFTEIADELAARFGNEGINMLIFKGISLAQYYAIPGHREFGDLDIYLFGQQKAGNQLLRQWGAQENKKQHSYKHSVFRYKGISIENHACFLDIYNSRAVEVNKKLTAMAEAKRKGTLAGKPIFPSPDFTALFFMAHTINHFVKNSPIGRYFYDWAIFLHANKGKWDKSRYDEALSEAGLKRAADTYTAITVDWLKLPLDEAPPFERNEVLEEKILTAMFHPMPPLQEEYQHSFWKILAYKYRCFMDRRLRCELIYPGAFRKMILSSILYHIRYPDVTWKLEEEY